MLVSLLAMPVALAQERPTGQLAPCREVPESAANPVTAPKAELGKKLFFDRRLSGDGTTACATCHIPELAFTDGQAIALSYPTTQNWRNTPTLVNLAFNTSLFHDGRAATIEEQALFPIMSAFEMNQNLDFLEEELRSVPEYTAEFAAVFGSPDINRDRIALAIAAYERTLVSKNAPIDRFLEGDKSALSPAATRGYEFFIGKAKCATCHFGVNLNDNKFHALLVPEHPDFQNDPRVAATRRFVAKLNHYDDFRILTEDPGRYLISKEKKDWRAFRTPTLREITRTAPYMHNGIFETLDEVIAFFNKGGGLGNTILQPLELSSGEMADIKAFLVEGLKGAPLDTSVPKVP